MSFSYEKKAIFPSLPRTERARSLVLGGDPKGKTFLYTHDTNVFIRDIENPSVCEVYCDHSRHTTVAKYAPSGFYICSGDVGGKIRIWDTVNKTHILKYEYQPLSGRVNDIAWSPDSKRIAICGEGQQSYASVILWDSGSTVGQISAHIKSINSVDFKQTRPYRIVTASEDAAVSFYEGPPFKFKTKHDKLHSNFVNTTRFSPDGNFFASGCSGGKLNFFDGKTGEFIGEIIDDEKAHKGGIYQMAWSPDSTHLLTVSGDKTAKLWDVDTKQLVTKFEMGTTLEDQQLSCLWQGDYMLTVSLSGYINYLDKNNPSTPLRIIKGHNKNITAMSAQPEQNKIFTSGLDNKTLCWDSADTNICNLATGKLHTNMVSQMCCQSNTLTSIGLDDTIRFLDVDKEEYTDEVIGLDSQPSSLSTVGDKMAVGSESDICLFSGHKKVWTEKINYKATSLCFSPSGSQLVVGGSDKKVHVFTVLESDLKEVDQVPVSGVVNFIKYSPDGEHLAFCADKSICLYKVDDMTPVATRWGGHYARITTLAWSPDNKRFASGGIDGNIFVWDLDQKNVSNLIQGAHVKSVVVSLEWLDSNTIVSSSHDKCTIVWKV